MVTNSDKKTISETTLDTIRDLKLYQYKEGYRFSIDAVLLYSFATVPRAGRIADLGAGSGVVGLLLARKYPKASVTLVEIQESLYMLARRNIEANRLEDRVRALKLDIKDLAATDLSGLDMVVANPPFRRPLAGRLSSGRERAVARHELRLTLPALLEAASRLLKTRGRLFLVHHPERIAEIVGEMKRTGLEPKRLRFVHGSKNAEARILLVEAVKQGSPGLKVDPPLFVYEDDGKTYTREVRNMYGI